MNKETSGTDVLRMTLWQRVEHLLMMAFVLLLVVSGLSLVYHQHAWAKILIRCMGGMEGRYLVHRWAAAGLLLLGIAHLVYLAASARGRRDFRDSLPTGDDFSHLWGRFRFRMTGKGEAPRFGHYTPRQKFQYWGIFLCCAVMGVSGLFLWFKAEALQIFPKVVFDLMLLVHSEQAQLIVILFVLWHLYDVHLAEGNFPMNPAWITGRMPLEAFKRQHAAEYEAAKKEGRL